LQLLRRLALIKAMANAFSPITLFYQVHCTVIPAARCKRFCLQQFSADFSRFSRAVAYKTTLRVMTERMKGAVDQLKCALIP